MFDRILIPTDGSDEAEAAVEYALELAQLTGAEVHALYVIETRASYIITLDVKGEEMAEYEEYGRRVVEDVVRRADEVDLEAVGSIKKGKVASQIVEYANDNRVDQIVVGGRGQGAVGRYLGSTAQKVANISDIPVTIVEA